MEEQRSQINLYHGDCMAAMATMKDNQYDLAIVDPPYNIGKAQWDKVEDYQNWILSFMQSLERVMKDNGSVYFFHNDFNQLAEIQHNINKETGFILRQFITWNKRFALSKNKGFFDGYVQIEGLRNYQKLAEYCLFYTFQDETGLSKIMDSCVYPIRDYIRSEILKAKGVIKFKEINTILGTATNGGGVASACLSIDKEVPAFITEDHYLKLRDWLNARKEYSYLRKEYSYLRKEYEDLRKEYEDLRYYFNNQKTCHSVWEFDIADKETKHPTEKPKALINNILLHSCRPEGKVFSPFGGSFVDAIACHDLKFDLDLWELDKDYYEDGKKRFEDYTMQGQFNFE